jgi:PncC family amidohydrolase
MFDKDIIQQIADRIWKRKQTIAVAESVTAGLLQNVFASAKDATCFFQGGLTAYNLEQKVKHLGIDEKHALECNCVSAKVASEMAVGVAGLFSTEWGIGITGYASPVPEENINELFAWYAFARNGNIITATKIEAEKDTPQRVQSSYVNKILESFLVVLKES